MALPVSTSLPFYLVEPTPDWYSRLPWYTLDLETTNLEHGDPWIPENRAILSVLRRPDGKTERAVTLPRFGDKPIVLVAHNAKFELGWLAREGQDLSNLLVWDTMLAEYVLAGNRRVPLDLGSVAARYGLVGKDPVTDRMMKAGICPSEMPAKWIEERCVRDVETTHAVAVQQMTKLSDLGLLAVFFTRCIVTPVLALMEGRGVTLDPDRVNAEHATQSARLAELAAELAVLTGGINLASRKQLGEVLYDKLGFEEPSRRGEVLRTAAGGRKTDKATLEGLRAKTPEQKRFVELMTEYNRVSARLTKTLNFFRGVCEEYGGTFRARFNQAVTQTHRLSSSGRRLRFKGGAGGVQFQNMPREYKRLVRAKDPDYVVVETDGAQLEFRVAGEVSHDPQVKHDVETGADIHRYTASILKRKAEADVGDKERTAAKAHTFKPLYGGMSGTTREKEYYAAFREKYSVLYDVQMGWVAEALGTKQTRAASGLIFYWNGTMRTDGYVPETPSIFNYPIQSFATADIIPVSLVYTFWRAREVRAVLVNTVHDSVVGEVHKEDVDEYRKIVVRSWLQDTYRYVDLVYGRKLWVPLGIGMKAAPHWGDTKDEWKYTEEYVSE